MEQISPTRMNMLIKKRQINVAESGASLLKNKRDALLQEFMEILSPLLGKRKEIEGVLKRAVSTLILTLGIDGPEEIRSASLASKKEYLVNIVEKKLWGVKIPDVCAGEGKRNIFLRGYNPLSVTTRIDETADIFESLLDIIVKTAPMEIKMKKIGEEIKKTTRRVNALEQRVIPALKEEVTFIRRTLEDREREDKFRLKRLKAKTEK